METKKVTAKKTAVKKTLKRKSASKAVVAKKTTPKGYVVVDFPLESEIISSEHYALRIGASDNGYAEVSINNGEWLPTRFNDGYWWFDLYNLINGKHTIVARLCDNSGTIIVKSKIRNFSVV